jgi:hypothetical protein
MTDQTEDRWRMAAARMSEAWQAGGQAVYDTQEDLAAGLPHLPQQGGVPDTACRAAPTYQRYRLPRDPPTCRICLV